MRTRLPSSIRGDAATRERSARDGPSQDLTARLFSWVMTDVTPDGESDELGGRVNTDLPFEDVVQVMLNTDLREPGKEAEVTSP